MYMVNGEGIYIAQSVFGIEKDCSAELLHSFRYMSRYEGHRDERIYIITIVYI